MKRPKCVYILEASIKVILPYPNYGYVIGEICPPGWRRIIDRPILLLGRFE